MNYWDDIVLGSSGNCWMLVSEVVPKSGAAYLGIAKFPVSTWQILHQGNGAVA